MHVLVKVSVVRFAAEPTVVLSLASGRSKEEITEQITQIQFTGKNTRIADAVELALQQLEDSKRPDATQVMVRARGPSMQSHLLGLRLD